MKHKLFMTFYSPVHIGSGEELEPFQYIVKDNHLHRFSFEQFVAALTTEDKEKLLQLQKEQKASLLKDIRNFVRHRVTPGLYRESIAITQSAAEIYENKFLEEANNMRMDTFIKTMGCPYVPGSSLKGAMRTAVLNLWAQHNHQDEFHILNAKYRYKDGKEKDDIPMDVFKYLKIPDIPLSKAFTIFSRIANYRLKNNELQETRIQIIKEVTRWVAGNEKEEKKSCFELVLQIDEEKMKDLRAETGRRDLTFETVWKSLDFYKGILRRETEKWSQYNDSLKKFYDGFFQYLDREGKKGETKVIKLGYGSGFDALTIEKIRDDRIKHGNSINLCEQQYPLGWVVLQKE